MPDPYILFKVIEPTFNDPIFLKLGLPTKCTDGDAGKELTEVPLVFLNNAMLLASVKSV